MLSMLRMGRGSRGRERRSGLISQIKNKKSNKNDSSLHNTFFKAIFNQKYLGYRYLSIK